MHNFEILSLLKNRSNLSKSLSDIDKDLEESLHQIRMKSYDKKHRIRRQSEEDLGLIKSTVLDRFYKKNKGKRILYYGSGDICGHRPNTPFDHTIESSGSEISELSKIEVLLGDRYSFAGRYENILSVDEGTFLVKVKAARHQENSSFGYYIAKQDKYVLLLEDVYISFIVCMKGSILGMLPAYTESVSDDLERVSPKAEYPGFIPGGAYYNPTEETAAPPRYSGSLAWLDGKEILFSYLNSICLDQKKIPTPMVLQRSPSIEIVEELVSNRHEEDIREEGARRAEWAKREIEWVETDL